MLVHRLEHPHQCRKKFYKILHSHLDAIAINTSKASDCVAILAEYLSAN